MAHMTLVLMFNPMLTDLFIVKNYVGREIATIAPTKGMILLKNGCFYKASNKFCFPRTTIGYV
jgi:hypothetical protein